MLLQFDREADFVLQMQSGTLRAGPYNPLSRQTEPLRESQSEPIDSIQSKYSLLAPHWEKLPLFTKVFAVSRRC